MREIRLATVKDLPKLASIFSNAFAQADPNKPWKQNKALKLMEYFYKRQSDLFYTATEEKDLMGGMAVNIKPWRDGNRCQDAILFIEPQHQKKGIGKLLFKKVISESIKNYQTKTFEGITFVTDEFPVSWYKKLGITQDKWAIVIKGNCREMLEKLENKII